MCMMLRGITKMSIIKQEPFCAFDEGIFYSAGILLNQGEPVLAADILWEANLHNVDITLLDDTERYAMMALNSEDNRINFTWDSKHENN